VWPRGIVSHNINIRRVDSGVLRIQSNGKLHGLSFANLSAAAEAQSHPIPIEKSTFKDVEGGEEEKGVGAPSAGIASNLKPLPRIGIPLTSSANVESDGAKLFGSLGGGVEVATPAGFR
jgi:hypothetical protein